MRGGGVRHINAHERPIECTHAYHCAVWPSQFGGVDTCEEASTSAAVTFYVIEYDVMILGVSMVKIITLYQPNDAEWTQQYSRRR